MYDTITCEDCGVLVVDVEKHNEHHEHIFGILSNIYKSMNDMLSIIRRIVKR